MTGPIWNILFQINFCVFKMVPYCRNEDETRYLTLDQTWKVDTLRTDKPHVKQVLTFKLDYFGKT